MTKTKGTASVVMTATVEVSLSSSWDGTETMENLARNAGGEARALLERLLLRNDARIVGKPTIKSVWFNSDNKPIDDFEVNK